MSLDPNLLQSFLFAMREKPEDLTTRLAYADYCLENGDTPGECARGEYIQLCLKQPASLSESDVRARRGKLLSAYFSEWLDMDGLSDEEKKLIHPSTPNNPEYFSGFFDHVFIQLKNLEEESGAEAIHSLLERYPVETLNIDNDKCISYGALKGFSDASACPSLKKLSFSSWHQAAPVTAEARACLTAFLRRQPAIRSLHAQELMEDPDFAHSLCRMPFAQTLENLSLTRLTPDAATFASLESRTHFPRLREIDFDVSTHNFAAFTRWLRSPVAAHIEEMEISVNDETSGVTEALAAQLLPKLDHLTLYNFPEGTNIAALSSPHLSNLRGLYIVESRFNPFLEDFIALLTSPYLNRLQTLDIPGGVANEGEALPPPPALLPGQMPCLKNLEIGSGDGNRIAPALCQLPHLTALERLSIVDAELDGEHAPLLFKAPALAGLKSIDLWFNRIDDDGARAIMRTPRWKQMEDVRLGDTDTRVDNPLSATMREQVNKKPAARIRD